MPGGIQTTEDEVIERILTMNVEEECQKTREMLKNKFTYIGGHATEICVEKVFKIKNTTHS
jgi:CDP-glycerol glycerophosphotransferase